MTAGIIADIVVALAILIAVITCTVRGFLRSVLKCASSFVALLTVIFATAPLAGWLDRQFNLCAEIATWKLPVVTPNTLLFLMTAVGLFLVVRLALLLLDKLLAFVKERVKTVNAVDHVLGFVFGLAVATVELTVLFMMIDTLGLASALQLTPNGGGYFAHHLFSFLQAHVFPIVSQLFSTISNGLVNH